MSEDRRHLIDGLRALAGFYEKYPGAYYDGTGVSLSMYLGGRKARSTMAAMARIFAEYEEIYDEKYAAIAMHFGTKVTLELFAPRAKICRATVVGTRIEPALVIPAVGEISIPERVVKVMEWNCLSLLGLDRKSPTGQSLLT